MSKTTSVLLSMYMVRLSDTTPWTRTAITIAAIIFTPIVGGILGALNQRRMGFKKEMWLNLGFSLLAYLWYSGYHFIVNQHILAGALFIPQNAIILSLGSNPFLATLFLLLPSTLFIYFITTSQKQLQYRSPRYDPSIYVLGAVLTILVGIALVYTQALITLAVYG